MEKLVPCPTCDGTGEVHSHNPKCWDCHGKRMVAESVANKLKEEMRKRSPWYYSESVYFEQTHKPIYLKNEIE